MYEKMTVQELQDEILSVDGWKNADALGTEVSNRIHAGTLSFEERDLLIDTCYQRLQEKLPATLESSVERIRKLMVLNMPDPIPDEAQYRKAKKWIDYYYQPHHEARQQAEPILVGMGDNAIYALTERATKMDNHWSKLLQMVYKIGTPKAKTELSKLSKRYSSQVGQYAGKLAGQITVSEDGNS